MSALFWTQIVGDVLLGVALALNLRSLVRWGRTMRTLDQVQERVYAYEKELLEKGVTLPARCIHCRQVLPAHVDGCELTTHYQELGWIMEMLTRPPIHYDPTRKKKLS